MRGHLPGQVDCCRPGLVVPGLQGVVGQGLVGRGVLLGVGDHRADQVVLGHLPERVG